MWYTSIMIWKNASFAREGFHFQRANVHIVLSFLDVVFAVSTFLTDNIEITYTNQNLERAGMAVNTRGPLILSIVSENLINPIRFKKEAISSEARMIERTILPKAKVIMAKYNFI